MNLASSLILRIGCVFGFVYTVYYYARVDAGACIQAKESSAPQEDSHFHDSFVPASDHVANTDIEADCVFGVAVRLKYVCAIARKDPAEQVLRVEGEITSAKSNSGTGCGVAGCARVRGVLNDYNFCNCCPYKPKRFITVDRRVKFLFIGYQTPGVVYRYCITRFWESFAVTSLGGLNLHTERTHETPGIGNHTTRQSV